MGGRVGEAVPRAFVGGDVQNFGHRGVKRQHRLKAECVRAGSQPIHGQAHPDVGQQGSPGLTLRVVDHIPNACGTRRVEDVPWHPSKSLRSALEKGSHLPAGLVVEAGLVGSCKVAHHRGQGQLRSRQKRLGVRVLCGRQAQAVHARVEFQMHRPPFDAMGLGPLSSHSNVRQRDELRLQFVTVHRSECGRIGVQHEDSGLDSRLPQCHTLVGVRHGQPVHTLGLQKTAQHHGVGAVAKSFDDGDHT